MGPTVKVVLTVNEQGQVSVEAPSGLMANKFLMYGILDEAKQAVREFDPRKISLVVPKVG